MGFKRSDLGYPARGAHRTRRFCLPVSRRGALMPGNSQYAVRALNELR
jgi:hypothetical protein